LTETVAYKTAHVVPTLLISPRVAGSVVPTIGLAFSLMTTNISVQGSD